MSSEFISNIVSVERIEEYCDENPKEVNILTLDTFSKKIEYFFKRKIGLLKNNRYLMIGRILEILYL